MRRVATFNVPMDGLARLLGFPPGMRIVRCHALPHQFGDEDGVRFVVESPELPPVGPNEETPFVVPRYTLNADTYRRFEGFDVVDLIVRQKAGAVDDSIGTL